MAAALGGRVGIVTGAGKGIGAAIALAAAAEGAAVCVVDVDEAAAADVGGQIETAGGKGLAAAADVADFAQVEAAARSCSEELGEVDFLVANAGIGDYSLMSDGDPERWRRLLEINLLGAAHSIRAVLAGMKE